MNADNNKTNEPGEANMEKPREAKVCDFAFAGFICVQLAARYFLRG